MIVWEKKYYGVNYIYLFTLIIAFLLLGHDRRFWMYQLLTDPMKYYFFKQLTK